MDTSSLADAPFPEVDRRRSNRHVATYRAWVRLGPRVFVDCRTLDIGGGGVALWSREPLALGSTVQMALQLPDTHRGGPRRVAMASATVIASGRAGEQFRTGLVWVTPNNDALAALTVWLEARPR